MPSHISIFRVFCRVRFLPLPFATVWFHFIQQNYFWFQQQEKGICLVNFPHKNACYLSEGNSAWPMQLTKVFPFFFYNRATVILEEIFLKNPIVFFTTSRTKLLAHLGIQLASCKLFIPFSQNKSTISFVYLYLATNSPADYRITSGSELLFKPRETRWQERATAWL